MTTLRWLCILPLWLLVAAPAMPEAVPTTELPLHSLVLDRLQGQFLLDGAPYSGFATVEGSDGTVVERAGFVDGRRHGSRDRWYPDGSPSQHVEYRRGRMHGTSQTWFRDGTKRSEGRLRDGVADGVQRQWYASGALFKEIRLVDGVEQGLQRAWRENGAIYNNYEARDGRIYGLRRSKLCFDLDDEAVVLGP
ncbi:MAG: antitoxin component YwqK of YwqJK toxin-antitoxin module [Myxococcota bacterium]|jgi:antitoxin component YwqK of YwqJK toxin-antitoxin module